MLQGWHHLTSVHWRYPPAVVQAFLPDNFRVDTFDGDAWVGLIPFQMDRIRIPFGRRGLGAGRFSSFPETNVRTYIVDPRGRRGVWFFSLDITRIAPTLVARVSYGLPYCWADMTIEDLPGRVRYTSRRRWPRPAAGRGASHMATATSLTTIRIGERCRPDSPDAARNDFLSARWALGSTFFGRSLWADVDHPPWELHDAELLACDASLVSACGLPAPTGEPVVLWSPGVEVRIGRPHLVRPVTDP
jgi:uncharacterized protein YqjF (DUF2071 family)